MARLAIRTLLLVCAALPAAATTLGSRGDTIENRLHETPRARTNNQRGIVLVVTPPQPPPQG